MDILDEFYFGEIIPHANLFRNNVQYQQALVALQKCVEQLNTQLSAEGKESLEKLLDANADMASVIEAEKFKFGFRLGVRLMCSSFFGETDGKEKIFDK